MKRILGLLCGIVLLSFFTFSGCEYRFPGLNGKTSSRDNTASLGGTASESPAISEEKAEKIALDDAGVKPEDVSGIRTRLEFDDGRLVYEVDFYAGNKEYDYTISAADGTIYSKDLDIEDDFNWNIGVEGNPSQSASDNSTGTSGTITADRAAEIALARVPGASSSNLRLHLDWEDGRQIYEGSIVYNEREYDFEIDAVSGSILEWEEESVYD